MKLVSNEPEKFKVFAVAWYKAKFGDGHALDDGISTYSMIANVVAAIAQFDFAAAAQLMRLRFSHCEIWEPDELGRFVLYDKKNKLRGTCFTSTMRGGAKGTVLREASKVFTHPARWTVTFLAAREEDYLEAVQWRDEQVAKNTGYNMRTILEFFNPFRKTLVDEENTSHICSVASQGWCWKCRLFDTWRVWTPLRFWWMLRKRYNCHLQELEDILGQR